MIINGHSVQFNYKMAGYKSIDEVPYWRIYVVRRKKVITRLLDGRHWKHTCVETIYRYTHNFPIEVVYDVAGTLEKGQYIIAYPRKRMTNRLI